VLAGEDRRGLYAEVCSVVSQTGTNIRSVELTSGEGGMTGSVVVEVESLTHLNKVIKAIRRVKGVVEVRRRDRAIA
jgi:GTP pyrophosphokinase